MGHAFARWRNQEPGPAGGKGGRGLKARGEQSPEPKFGWVMVAMVPLYLGFAIGSLGAISVFLKPLVAEFHWLRVETTFAYMMGNLMAGGGGLILGHLADRFSTRRIVLLGALVMGLAFLAMARMTSLWQFQLLFTMSSGFGAAAFFSPLLANVGAWFNHNKGLALGIATAGQALGQGFVPYAASLLIAEQGWRGAFNAMGVFALACLLPLALLIRNPPAAPGMNQGGALEPEVFPVPPRHALSLLSVAAIFCCITMSTPLVHVVALASDQGLSGENSARVLLTIMIAGFFGRIFFGRLTDWIGGLRAYMTASLWQTSLVFWFTQVSTPGGFYLVAALFGFGFAGVMTCLIICAQGSAPAAKSGFATALVAMFGFLGMGIGGFQAGFFYDLTGGYTLSYANAVFTGIVNLTILSALAFYRSRNQPRLAA